MDRLDYLRRDSFYTGVSEGNIGSARIIKMLGVKDDHLVMEAKGIYSIENFLVNRRLMYWQVYLHKTSVTSEKMLISALLRAKELAAQGEELFCSPALRFFLYNKVDQERFYHDPTCLQEYVQLDDNDIWTALKVWTRHKDIVLSTLSKGLVDRHLFKVEVLTEPMQAERREKIQTAICERLQLPREQVHYFFSETTVEKDMYSIEDDSIEIIYNDGTIKNIADASDMLNLSVLSRKVKKYYVCYYRL
jgi:hypothetical protein